MPFFSTLIFFFDSAGRVVRLAASVCVSDIHIPTVLLLLYGRVYFILYIRWFSIDYIALHIHNPEPLNLRPPYNLRHNDTQLTTMCSMLTTRATHCATHTQSAESSTSEPIALL